jgi:putative transposase
MNKDQVKGQIEETKGKVKVIQVKYLNNIIEQDHRFIKKIGKPMMGFKAFHSTKATLDGIETAPMIRKGQLTQEGHSSL